MRYSRFETGFTRHRKVIPLSDAAYRLWTGAVDHAKEHGTDGLILAAAVSAIPRGPTGGGWRRTQIAELEASGLFECTAGGWLVHDYLDYQDSADTEERSRKRSRERMRNVRATFTGTPEERSPEQLSLSCSPSPALQDSSESPGSEPLSEDLSGSARVAVRPRKPPARRWRRVPDAWQPGIEHEQIAANLRLDFALELAKFRDHEFKDPKSDADATFRNWLRTAKVASGPAPGLQQYRAQQESPGRKYKLFPSEQANARRERRNALLQAAKDGRHGLENQRRALAGRDLGKLVDELERLTPAPLESLLGKVGADG